ncbi:MAG TPA: glycogen synthase GlgA [Roseiarcus sp.]|nr:glycogen synthase GlgA [Roseiarcus sp.]
MNEIKALSVASEAFPLVKTGGLADVVGALPRALGEEGVRIVTLIPGYPAVMKKLNGADPVLRFDDLLGGPAQALAAKSGGLDLFVLDAPHFFQRDGGLYIGPDGVDWPDNALRFAALARAAADIAKGAVGAFAPDVVHVHDWQAALTPAYLHYEGGRRPGAVLTVHNLAFQGAFPPAVRATIGLPPQAMAIDGVEYYGNVGYLKAGLQFADRITTVSPTYAREIMTPQSGMGLDGVLRARGGAVSGILNGIDEEIWNPATDPHLPQPFSAQRIDQRPRNKIVLQKRMDLAPKSDAALFGVVTRISWQKGLDLLLEALPSLTAAGGQLAMLGSGEAALERGFADAARDHLGSVGCMFAYDEGLAHLIQGGADFLLVPSRFEPCGLTQLCALRYGAIPVVSRVGGLADTIVDANEAALLAGVATGVQFAPTTTQELVGAVERALTLFEDPAAVRRARLNGMRADVSWRAPAKRYAALYREIAGGVGAAGAA